MRYSATWCATAREPWHFTADHRRTDSDANGRFVAAVPAMPRHASDLLIWRVVKACRVARSGGLNGMDV
jgi:hypothetical protein